MRLYQTLITRDLITRLPLLALRAAVHRPTQWEANTTNEWEWVARWLRAVKGKLAALIAPLTLRDPGQPFTTVLPGL